jgi:uncharacterized protein YndB with AHSA1/START domain
VAQERFCVEVDSPAPPEAVFAVIADGAGWNRWAGPAVRHSSWDRTGTPPPGGVGAVRKLGAWPVFSREEIVEYDPPGHLAYTILSGQPVRGYRADVHMTPNGSGTHIRWEAAFEPKIPGTGAAIRLELQTFVGMFARRLAAYAAEAPTG